MTEYHVIYSEASREWKVKKSGSEKASRTAPTKSKPVKKAKDLAENNRPASVHIHYKNPGIELKPIQREVSYPPLFRKIDSWKNWGVL